MAFPLYTYAQKTAEQIRQDFLRTLSSGLILRGVTDTPNIAPGSDYYLIGQGLGNELEVVQANGVVTADAGMPDTAAGTDLDRWGNLLGMSRRPALPSRGQVTVACSVPSTTVVTGAQLTDSGGLRYQVITGGIYTVDVTGKFQVPVIAIDTGEATNHANGDVLNWSSSAPPYCAPTATVGLPGGTDGLSFGADSEVGNDEPFRARILDRLANPPRGGNWSYIATSATNSTPIVQAAFVYPALIGPATGFFCVVGAPQTVPPFSSTSKSRQIASAIVSSLVTPFVQGDYPEFAFLCGTSAVDQPVDIAILLDLPSAASASPPGPGGGWLDGTPWPQSIGGTTPVSIQAGSTPTSLNVNASTPPIPGVSRIAWLSPLTWQVANATVTGVTGSPGSYTVTIDTPFVGIATGNYIWPQSQNQAAYVAAILQAFLGLGPGEWSLNPAITARAYRHPQATKQWPSNLDGRFLKQVISVGPEVEDASWIFRSAIAPTVPASVTVDPVTGALTSTPPACFVPRNIALLPA